MIEIKPASKPMKKGRKPYVKPRIETVELRPKETVLGVCKSPSLAANEGPGGGSCATNTTCYQDSF